MMVKNEIYDSRRVLKTVTQMGNRFCCLKICSISKSCFGKPIPCLKIGGNKPAVLFAGAFHGSEHITAVVLLKFAFELCSAIESKGSLAGVDALRAFAERSLIIVPMVNPDGCDLAIHGVSESMGHGARLSSICAGDFTHWNANGRGVDLNHNFPAGWNTVHSLERRAGIFGPAPTKFGGYHPLSEPETVALAELCSKNPIRHVVAFHSQGEVIYWNYAGKSPGRGESMARVMAATSGYAMDVPVGTAIGGGFKDWFIDRFDRPGFTVELGLGQNPLPPEDAGKIYEDVREMMMISIIM